MGILDDHNHMAGAFTERRPAPTRHLREARLWGVVGVVASVVWLVGGASLVAIAAGTYSWSEYRRAGRRPTLAVVSVVLGVAGVVIAAVIIVANLPTEADALPVSTTMSPGR